MKNNIEKHIGNFVVILAVISYFQFFKISLIPYSIQVLSQITICGIMLVLIIIRIIYQPDHQVRMNFGIPVLILILASLPSFLIAQSDHNQNFLGSFIAHRVIWFYLLYYFVHFYKISVRFILWLLLGVGILAVILFFAQYFLYPKVFMDILILKDRGTIRLFVAGMLCTQVAYFYFLNQFFAKNKILYLVLALLCFSIFILQGTRQLIFALAFLTLIELFFSRRIKSKFLVTLVVSMAVVAVFFVFREIFIEINRVSTSQAGNFGGGIRIKAARFYLSTFMDDGINYLFGNGESSPGSQYNQRIMLYALKYGFYLSDIGIVGDFIKYGLIFCLAGVTMLIKAIRFKVSPQYAYLKYYIYAQCFTMIAGTGIFAGVDIIILFILYIFDVDRSEKLIRIQQNENLSVP